LSFSSGSHPKTARIVAIAMQIAQFQGLWHKTFWNRPRPSQLYPVLLPPIDVPPHAAYPSGHATEAHLLALVLEEILPDEIKTLTAAGAAKQNPPLPPTQAMAQRIARNREVLGLHYPSDTVAGKALAEFTFPLLMACDQVSRILDAAKDEWAEVP